MAYLAEKEEILWIVFSFSQIVFMTTPITITGKRQWREGKYHYMECYCNEYRIANRWEEVEDEFSKSYIVKSLKNTCKLIKLFGDPEYRNGVLSAKDRKAFIECELPEWDL